MKKNLLTITWLIPIFLLPLQALQVNKDELQTAGTDTTIVFQNYTGPHAKIDSIAEIRGIGQKIAEPIAQDFTTSITTGANDYYQVIHAINPTETTGLDADIFIIGKNATVDHITNLRRIIGSYLETAYGYSQEDAETLSVFITVYNAVYYGNIEAYKEKYKNIAIENLSSTICGLSVNYKEWPGNTQIVIPLSDLAGGLSTIETSIISDKQVVESMQEDPEKQIDVRKDMVDIKERESDNATEIAQTAQKEASAAKTEVTQEKEALEIKKQEATIAQKEAITTQKVAEANPDNKEAQQLAKGKQEVVENKQQEVRQQEDVVAEKEAVASEKQTIATEKQAVADKKQSEAQDERIQIADDQLEVIKEKTEAAKIINTTYGLRMSDTKRMLSTLVIIDSDTGLLVKESPVSYIRNRTVLQNGENYTAIAGENSGNGAVKLVTLDKTNMEIIDESELAIAEDSVLVSDSESFYAVLQDASEYVLGKFNTDLDLVLKSVTIVLPQTPIIISDSRISVTNTEGMIKLLNKKDLSEIKNK